MKTTLIRSLSVLAIAACLPFTASAMKVQTADVERAAEIAANHLQAQRAAMQLPDATDFSVRQADADELGQTHVRVDQLLRGVPVFGGELIVHVDNASGRVLRITDNARRHVDVDTNPELTEGHAIAVANSELMPMGAYNIEPTARLVIFQDEETGATALAYHVHTELENQFETSHTDFLIDAHTGSVLDRWSSLETGFVAGAGNSQYSGRVTISTNQLTSGYEMRDSRQNRTMNLNHATSGNGTIYTDADNTWGDSANYVEGSSTTAANGQTAAVDAHWGMQKTLDYYQAIHGRNGIDAAGTPTMSRVHYSNAYDNAFWSDSCYCMTYGDGNSFKTLTSMDVAGHEMSHGVCARTANLAYRKESGGLNEGNSDIFGTCVEFYSGSSGGGNYEIGEQLSSKALRFMYKPSKDGRSPDCYSSTVGRLDVHYSSGIANRFFYFLAEGSTNLSGAACNGKGITGIGRAKAEKIWYRALTVYMTSSTNYSGARVATLNAARDLAGSLGADYSAQVAAAWDGVNVH